MRIVRWLKSKDEGGLSVLTIFVIMIILCVFLVFLNLASLYCNYTSLDSKLQCAVNGAVEYSMIDAYRADGVLKLDSSVASAKLNEYLYSDLGLDANGVHSEDGKEVYRVSITHMDITEQPPKVTLTGTVIYTAPISLFGHNYTSSYNFSISSTNISLIQ